MLYLFCFIVGGGLLALSVLSGHDHDASTHGLEGAPASGPALGAHELNHPDTSAAHASGLGGEVASYFSLRALVSFTAFFGLGGLAAVGLGLRDLAQLGFALLCGLLVGAFAAVSLRLARTRGEVDTHASALEGRTGVVLVAPTAQRLGKVALPLEGQQAQLLARSDDALKPGARIIVIGTLPSGVLDVRSWDGR